MELLLVACKLTTPSLPNPSDYQVHTTISLPSTLNKAIANALVDNCAMILMHMVRRHTLIVFAPFVSTILVTDRG